MKLGQFYVATCTSSDSSQPLDNSLTVAGSADSTKVSVTKNADNTFTVTGVGVGGPVAVTYSAPGFSPAVEQVTVDAMPQIVVADGPIQNPTAGATGSTAATGPQ